MRVRKVGFGLNDRSRENDLRMDLDLRNFGPISEGKIQLKPLTIFIGPNNSGKSYVATLIHALFDAAGSHSFHAGLRLTPRGPLFGSLPQVITREASDLQNRIVKMGDKGVWEVPSKLAESLSKKVLEEIFENGFSGELTGTYACRLQDLIKFGEAGFSIDVKFDSHGVGVIYEPAQERLKIKRYPPLSDNMQIRLDRSSNFRFRLEKTEDGIVFHVGMPSTAKEDRRFMSDRFVELIVETIASTMLSHLEVPCYYLPAARSGILQAHRLLAASIVRKVRRIGIEELGIPKISGVALKFVESLIDLPPVEGPLSRLASEFESALIRGEIVAPKEEHGVYPDIKYKSKDGAIALHRASSTVSEVAPLILYLRYYIEPGDLLVIEEPEAHLHPANIRILAKLLVRLRRAGINLIMTTHSEYLLEQISNFIMMERISARRRYDKYRYRKNDFLKADEIGVHLFKYSQKSRGYNVQLLDVSPEDGISEVGFVRVHDQLYDEAIRLERDLAGSDEVCE